MDQVDRDSAPARRPRPSLFIFIILAFIVIGAIWHGAWFGRTLSDDDIASALSGAKGEREVQHALTTIDGRLIKQDKSVERFIPAVLALVTHGMPQIRKNVAWVLGDVRDHPEVVTALELLVGDPHFGVRAQAATSLANHGSAAGREVLLELIAEHEVRAPVSGMVRQLLKIGEPVAEGVRLARIEHPGADASDVASPVDGRVTEVRATADKSIEKDAVLLVIQPADAWVMNGLAGLAVLGTAADREAVESLRTRTNLSQRTVQQLQETLKRLESR